MSKTKCRLTHRNTLGTVSTFIPWTTHLMALLLKSTVGSHLKEKRSLAGRTETSQVLITPKLSSHNLRFKTWLSTSLRLSFSNRSKLKKKRLKLNSVLKSLTNHPDWTHQIKLSLSHSLNLKRKKSPNLLPERITSGGKRVKTLPSKESRKKIKMRILRELQKLIQRMTTLKMRTVGWVIWNSKTPNQTSI